MTVLVSPSSIPNIYYAIFAFYEPFLCVLSLVGVLADPKRAHDQQASWPTGLPPAEDLPRATLMTILQLSHVCALIGILNTFILKAARTYLHAQPALQEKMVSALLTPLLFGDVSHFILTLYGLGDQRWNIAAWSSLTWITQGLGLTLLIPRICWNLGIGRYVDSRDRKAFQAMKNSN